MADLRTLARAGNAGCESPPFPSGADYATPGDERASEAGTFQSADYCIVMNVRTSLDALQSREMDKSQLRHFEPNVGGAA